MKFACSYKQQQTFIVIFDVFTKTPILYYYDPQRPSKVEMDVSDTILKAIFSQLFKDG